MEQCNVCLNVLPLCDELVGVVICCFGVSQTVHQLNPDQDKISAGIKGREQLAYCFCSTFNPCRSHEALFVSNFILGVVSVPLGR
jgi:hypothetical protein